MQNDPERTHKFEVTVSVNFDEVAGIWPPMKRAGSGSELPRAFAFQCREFISGWLNTVGRARRTQGVFVVVRDAQSNPLMLLPLAMERRCGVRVLGFIDGGLSDYNAPVLFQSAANVDEQMAREIWKDVYDALPRFDVLILEKVPKFVLDIPNPLGFLVSAPERNSGHVVSLTEQRWRESQRRSAEIKDSRRQMRRLEAIGPVRFLMASKKDTSEKILEKMIEQKRRRYLETRGLDGFERPGYREYFRAMTRHYWPSGCIHISALLVGDDIVATHWGLFTTDRFYYLMPAYEANWSKYSPGRLLMEELVRWCQEQGLPSFDLGIGDEKYKMRFNGAELKLFRGMYATSILGLSYLSVIRARKRIRETCVGKVLLYVRRRASLAWSCRLEQPVRKKSVSSVP